MWETSKSQRFQDLRSRELEGELSAAEQDELSHLHQELVEAEAALLAPALSRLVDERGALEAEAERLEDQKQALSRLLQEKEAYLARARAMVAELEAERSDLLARYSRIVGESLSEAEPLPASSGG